MQDNTELDRIVLTLLQVAGLLFPVALLTARYYFNEFLEDIETQRLKRPLTALYLIVFSVAVVGLFSTIAIFDTVLKEWLLFFAVVALVVFFASYLYLLLHVRDVVLYG